MSAPSPSVISLARPSSRPIEEVGRDAVEHWVGEVLPAERVPRPHRMGVVVELVERMQCAGSLGVVGRVDHDLAGECAETERGEHDLWLPRRAPPARRPRLQLTASAIVVVPARPRIGRRTRPRGPRQPTRPEASDRCSRLRSPRSSHAPPPGRRAAAGHPGTGATGLEPATSGATGLRCNQLNYAPARAWSGAGFEAHHSGERGDPARAPRSGRVESRSASGART